MTVVIEMCDVTKTIRSGWNPRRRTIVDKVTLSVQAGEVVGFLGPNGAGKTTSIRMMTGLSRPSTGECRVLGEHVPGDTLRKVGSLMEGPSFYPWMSGRRNLAVLAGVHDRRDAGELLERVGLSKAGERRAATYSMGMRQRLGLAVALAGRPAALILDEPGNGLDPGGIRDFRDLVREAADRGCAVLLSSHQLSEVERACDRAVVISGGHVVAEGSLDELGIDDVWLEVRLAPDQESAARSALVGTEVRSEGAGRLLVRASSGTEVGEELARAGIYPESMVRRSSSLEERFFSLTADSADG